MKRIAFALALGLSTVAHGGFFESQACRSLDNSYDRADCLKRVEDRDKQNAIDEERFAKGLPRLASSVTDELMHQYNVYIYAYGDNRVVFVGRNADSVKAQALALGSGARLVDVSSAIGAIVVK